MTGPHLRPVGDHAMLVEVAALDEALALHDALADAAKAGALPGVRELVPAARTVLVRFEPGRVDHGALARACAQQPPHESASGGPGPVPGTRVVELPVQYDGADLTEVAALLGCSPEALVRRHGAATWRVAFGGFAPGFAYLVGDDPVFDVPRHPTPRTRIPAGSVGLAGR